MLYLIQYDSVNYYAEAADLAKAVEAWKAHVKIAWGDDYDGTEEPESIALVHEEPVILVHEDSKAILEIVLREAAAIGEGWRYDWSDFDGRSLRSQMDELVAWARKSQAGPPIVNFIEGTEFRDRQLKAVS